MSIAVLARKTRSRQTTRNKNAKCPSYLNMTGRGGGIGRASFAGKTTLRPCPGLKINGGNGGASYQSNCCPANAVSKNCSGDNCDCYLRKNNIPAPQLSYRNYINRKSAGSFRPGGKICCDKPECSKVPGCYDKVTYIETLNCVTKNNSFVKPPPSLSSSDLIAHRKQAALRYNEALVEPNCGAGSCKTNTSFKAKEICQFVHKNHQSCPCYSSINVKGRLSYNRINHPDCTTTKPVTMGKSASDQVAKVKVSVNKCPCPLIEKAMPVGGVIHSKDIKKICDCNVAFPGNNNIKKRQQCKRLLSMYCFPRSTHAVHTKAPGIINRNICNTDGSIAIKKGTY